MTTVAPHEQVISVVQGQYEISADTFTRLSTVLGSCVSCCMYDATAKVGGMNHFLLANGGDNTTVDIKYGSHAMEMLINSLLKRGADRGRLQAKLFGGANITTALGPIGSKNADFAIDFLRREGITCISKSLGGQNARRIHFWPTTGAVKQFIVPRSDVVEEVARPKAPTPADDITLF